MLGNHWNAWFHTTCSSDIKGEWKENTGQTMRRKIHLSSSENKVNACIRRSDPV